MTDTEEKVVINVGGVRHEILVKTLQRFPETRLGKIFNSSEKLSRDKNEIYFDRNPLTFNAILDFYRTGNLHIDKNACPVGFCDELDFWIISKDQISTCCKDKWKDDRNAVEILDIEDSNQQTDNSVIPLPMPLPTHHPQTHLLQTLSTTTSQLPGWIIKTT